mmetsp:Transcript_31513/g.70912  ORF Transcript_31513/g.70912 Transcript_31513/m.70912 type:complete len:86 (+) Transcript_31513:253-510(+)
MEGRPVTLQCQTHHKVLVYMILSFSRTANRTPDSTPMKNPRKKTMVVYNPMESLASFSAKSLSEEMTLADPDCLLELKIDLFFCK